VAVAVRVSGCAGGIVEFTASERIDPGLCVARAALPQKVDRFVGADEHFLAASAVEVLDIDAVVADRNAAISNASGQFRLASLTVIVREA